MKKVSYLICLFFIVFMLASTGCSGGVDFDAKVEIDSGELRQFMVNSIYSHQTFQVSINSNHPVDAYVVMSRDVKTDDIDSQMLAPPDSLFVKNRISNESFYFSVPNKGDFILYVIPRKNNTSFKIRLRST